MSNEFRPGHPVLFTVVVAVLTFLMYSLAIAWNDQNDCEDVGNATKHWVVFPPGWECGGSGIKLTGD